ncbi:hypothetical protein ACFQZW_09400 [Lutibacter aestuarii]|uniref:Uncharacterized protein n=1 Tax=Lutibacter aestuarii TaxID=861111 RepID=A0ABW2Z676_9FLAO
MFIVRNFLQRIPYNLVFYPYFGTPETSGLADFNVIGNIANPLVRTLKATNSIPNEQTFPYIQS